MPRAGSRIRIARNITRDGEHGPYEIRVRVGGQDYTARCPADATIEELKRARADLESRGLTETPRAARGTLRSDAPIYLRLMAHLASVDDREDHLNAWIARVGDIPRHRLSSRDVLAARVAWLQDGKAPKTINHRCDTLRHLFHTLDGKRAPTPCDDVSPLPVPRTPIVRVSEAQMIAIDQRLQARERGGVLRDAKTRARFRVLVSTGKRPVEIMRARPEDVDLQQRVWVPRDGKGGWTVGVYLNADQLAAWNLFIEADAWGPFNLGNFSRVLRKAGWPEGVRVYQARHNTWMAASERGADLADISAGAGHRDLAMTRRAYVPVLGSRLQKLSERLDGRFGGGTWGPDLGTVEKRARSLRKQAPQKKR